MSQFFRSSTGL